MISCLFIPIRSETNVGADEQLEYYLRVRFYLNLNQPEEAENLIDKYLAKYPQDPFILTEKSYILNQWKGDIDGALQLLRQAVDIYPRYYYSNFLYASILFSNYLKKPKEKDLLGEILKYLDTSIRGNNQFFDSCFLAGIVASEKGDFGSSNRYFEMANNLKQIPTSYFYMATNYRELSDLDGEARSYEKVARLDPQNDRALKALAEVYLRKRDYFKAYQTLDKVRETDRDSIFYTLLFEIFSRLDLNERLVKTFQTIQKDDQLLRTLTIDDYYHLVFAFGNLKRFTEAYQVVLYLRDKTNREREMLTELLDLIRAFLNDEEIKGDGIRFDYNLFVLIDFYKNRSQIRQGTRLLQQILKKKSNLYLSLELCDHYFRQQEFEKVEQCLKDLQNRYPDAVEWKNFYAYFLGRRDRELDLALSLSAQTLEKDGESPAYIDTYGYILYKMGKYDKALQYLKRAYEKHPFEREIIQHIVDCYRRKRAKAEIVRIYRHAIRHGVDFKDELIEKLKSDK